MPRLPIPARVGAPIGLARPAAAALALAGLRVAAIERRLHQEYGRHKGERMHLEASRRAALDAIAWNQSAAARVEQLTARERQEWTTVVEPLIERVEIGCRDGDDESAVIAAAKLAEAIGQPLPWRDVASFDQFMRTGEAAAGVKNAELLLEEKEAAVGAQASEILGRKDRSLGETIGDGLALSFLALYRDLEPATPGLGSHIRAQRRGYWHHAVVVGNDRLVHYSGEAGRSKDAEIALTDWQGFMKDSEHCEAVVPTTLNGLSVTPILGSMVVLRAHFRLEERDYALFCNNCEHFAVWSQLGAGFSRQARHPLSNADVLGLHDAIARLMEPASEVLCYATEGVSREALMGEVPEDHFLDLGRAYVDRSTGDPAIYMPIWDLDGSSPGPPVGEELPWSDARGSAWHPTPVSGSLELDLELPFAALLWRHDVGAFWVTESGELLRPRFDLSEVIEGRIAPSRAMLNRHFFPGLLGEGLQRGASVSARVLEGLKSGLLDD